MVTVHGKKEEGVTVEEKAELLEGYKRRVFSPSAELIRAAAVATIKETARVHGLKVIVVDDGGAFEQMLNTLTIGTHLSTCILDKAIEEYFKNHPV